MTRRRVFGSLSALSALGLTGLAGVAGALAACGQPAVGPVTAVQSKGCSQPLELYQPWAETNAARAGLDKTIADFVATHPQCPLTVVSVVPWTTEKLTAALAGGAPPPLTMLAPTSVTTWAPQGLLDPVDDLFKRDKLTGTDFFPPVWETMGWNGKVWHVPVQVDPNFPFFWNKAPLREVGVNPDTPPQTLDALDQAAQKLNKEAGGQWERLAFVPWQWYGTGNALTAVAYMHGGTFFDTARKKVTYNHPQIVKGAEWMAGWAQRLGRQRANDLFTGTSLVALMAGGKIAYSPLVSINVLPIKQQNPSVELGYGPLPGGTAAQAGVVWTGGWHVAAVPGSKRKDDAWEFMRWIGTSAEGTTSVATQMGGLPGLAKSPGLDVLAKDAAMVAHVEAIKRAKLLPPSFYTGVSVDLVPLEDALDGKRTVKSALDEITEKAQQRFDELQTQTAQKK
jgi:multiple sugar transport system substrate-binding protein